MVGNDDHSVGPTQHFVSEFNAFPHMTLFPKLANEGIVKFHVSAFCFQSPGSPSDRNRFNFIIQSKTRQLCAVSSSARRTGEIGIRIALGAPPARAR